MLAVLGGDEARLNRREADGFYPKLESEVDAMFPRPFRPSSAVLRRAQTAGVIGSLVFGVAVVGEIADRSLKLLWVFVAFAGLGSILRATVLLVAAYRDPRVRSREAGDHSGD